MLLDTVPPQPVNAQPSIVPPVYTFQHTINALKNGESLEDATSKLLSELTKFERLSLLDGDVPFYEGLRQILCDRYNRRPFVMGAIPRLQIPGVRFTDGPRGVVMGSSTAFPVSMARGATWDIELERRIGDAIGKEAKAQGANFFAGVCVNLPRHPAWGRIQETYSEDPILLGEFGLALCKGVQKHVMACVKHFAANSMENARFRVDVKVEENVLHEVYLPHFRRIIEGGAASVMSSYNAVNGEWAGQSKLLLTDILRHDYNFDGFVISDFIFGLRDPMISLQNGLDIEAPFTQQRGMSLIEVLKSGQLDWAVVDRACERILRKQLDFALKTESSQPEPEVVFCEQHRKLAREAAARSIVMLKNDSAILPLDVTKTKKIAVIGRLANFPNIGDKGSSQVFSPHVVTHFEGLKTALPTTEVILEDSDDIELAKKAAESADTVVVIVGYDATDEGEYVVPSLQADPSLLKLLPLPKTKAEKEVLAIVSGESNNVGRDTALQVGAGGDRQTLRLRPRDVEIIKAVSATNQRTIVSVIAAGAVIMEEWIDYPLVVLMSWYSGSEGGNGLADMLLGITDASGRLPFSIPKDESHLPFFDIDAREIKYTRWLGQSLLDKMGVQARFPLGYGLSYTMFEFTNLQIDTSTPINNMEIIQVRFGVKNTGLREGRTVAQVYACVELPDFPLRVLLGFLPTDIAAKSSKLISIDVSTRPLQRWVKGKWVLPGREVIIEIAAYAGDQRAARSTITL